MLSSLLRSRIVQKPYQLFHYYFLLENTPNSTLADLSFETDISISIRKFKTHNWTIHEIMHYSFLLSIIFFVFIIFPASFLVKIPILAAFTLCFLLPLTSQFFVHALPIFTWLALFFSASKIPTSWKPAISVKVLPAMETILYGDNLSNVLATINTSFLDILAWLPYGIIHFSSPFVVALFIFLFGPPTGLRSFGFAFGYMNLLGVLTQILFPAAAPWYKNLYGLEPANYSMQGSPGGLARIDTLLGFDMYTTTFSNSPLIFGAFPSLHSGCATMDVLFLCWLFPRFRVLWWGYATLLWWSTMYLTHHYFIDLIGGAVLSFAVFQYTRYNHLPVVDLKCFCRWSYTEVEKVNIASVDPLSSHFVSISDIESAAPSSSRFANYPYFLSQNNGSVVEDFEMSTISRSRQASRTFLTSFNNADQTAESAPSSNSINHFVEEEEEDISSLENSATPSVFEDEHHQISTTASQTSLEDLESTGSSAFDATKPKGYKSR